MEEDLDIQLLTQSEISPSDNYINFKIIIIGDSGVGKSCLLKRAVRNIFDGNYHATIGFEYLSMHFRVNDLKIKLQIWDTCGQELYRSLIQGFYHNASLAIIVYDINQINSFKGLKTWYKDLKQNIEGDLPIFIIGNKNDLERNVREEEAKKFRDENDIRYFTECSAKSGYKVKEIFYEAAKCLYHEYKKLNIKEIITIDKKLKLDKNVNKDNSNKNQNKKCC